MNYTFVELTCDQATSSAVLKIIWKYDEDGEQQLRNPKENTYYFDAVAKSNQSPSCNLDNKHTLSFKSFLNEDHPRNNGVEIFINGDRVPASFMAVPAQIKLRIVSDAEYSFNFCSTNYTAMRNRKNCTDRHIINNKEVK